MLGSEDTPPFLRATLSISCGHSSSAGSIIVGLQCSVRKSILQRLALYNGWEERPLLYISPLFLRPAMTSNRVCRIDTATRRVHDSRELYILGASLKFG